MQMKYFVLLYREVYIVSVKKEHEHESNSSIPVCVAAACRPAAGAYDVAAHLLRQLWVINKGCDEAFDSSQQLARVAAEHDAIHLNHLCHNAVAAQGIV